MSFVLKHDVFDLEAYNYIFERKTYFTDSDSYEGTIANNYD